MLDDVGVAVPAAAHVHAVCPEDVVAGAAQHKVHFKLLTQHTFDNRRTRDRAGQCKSPTCVKVAAVRVRRQSRCQADDNSPGRCVWYSMPAATRSSCRLPGKLLECMSSSLQACRSFLLTP